MRQAPNPVESAPPQAADDVSPDPADETAALHPAEQPDVVVSSPEGNAGAEDSGKVVRCMTSKGAMTLRVRPEWSPHGAKRFLDLVRSGFFTQNVIYRVPPM